MSGCEFCNLSEKDKKWLLFENDYWMLFLSDLQDYPGRCILICKQHCTSISDLNTEQWLALKKIMSGAEKMLKYELGATMFNWSCLMNDAYKQINPQPHMHFHLRPRYSQPLVIGDNLFTDTQFSHHYDNNAKVQINEKTAELIYLKLKESVNKYFF